MGLIVLTGGPGGPLDLALAAGQADLAAARCARLSALFGNRLYVELQRHGRPEEKQVEPGLLDLAYANGIALVATNEPFYGRREDFEAHDALICIAEGRLVAESERRQLSAGALLQVARRDDGAVRRPARGARLDGGDRAALRLPAEDAQADPAALHRARTAPRSTRPPNCAARPTKG